MSMWQVIKPTPYQFKQPCDIGIDSNNPGRPGFLFMPPNTALRLRNTDRIYTLMSTETHYEGTPHEIEWAILRPPPPATHTAHWPMNQLEVVG